MSIPLILYAIAAMGAVGILMVYHYKITGEYLTTHEDLKGIYSGYIRHPYALGSSRFSIENYLYRLFGQKYPKYTLFNPTTEVRMKR